MRKRILATPLLVIIIFILVGIGGATAAILLGGGGASNEEVSLQKGLVGWWKMDGNAKDSTPYGNNGTVTGATLNTDRKGQALKAYSFDGVDDYVRIPDKGYFGAGQQTVELWIKPDVKTPTTYVFPFGASTGTDNRVYLIQQISGVFDIIIGENINYTLLASTEYSAGQWLHIVFTRDYDNLKLNAWVNGVQKITNQSVVIGSITTGQVEIGRFTATHNFQGLIDEVRIYNRALSAAEVLASYESYDPGIQVSDLQKGLVGQWKMDGNAKDSTPYGNNGTVTGATLNNDRKGQALKAYSFDGVDDYVDCGSGASLTVVNKITMEGWVYPRAYSAYPLFVENGAGTEHYRFGLGNSNGNIFWRFEISNNSAASTLTSANTIPLNKWSHVVVTYDGSLGSVNMKIYINGVQDANTKNITGNIDGGGPLLIGAHTIDGVGVFNGLIDEVRIYNRALSAAEVLASYESYDPGIQVSDLQKGLVGQWKFDGNAKDSTPYGNNGTVTGATLNNDRKGQALKAYSFDGVDDCVEIDSAITSLSSTIAGTWSGWFKLSDITPASNNLLIAFGDTDGNDYLEIGISTAGILFADAKPQPTTTRWVLQTDSIIGADNTWIFIAITQNGTSPVLYVNGVAPAQTFTTDIDRTYWFSQMTVFDNGRIGCKNANASGNVYFLNGMADEVRIYNRALSQAEITALYEGY